MSDDEYSPRESFPSLIGRHILVVDEDPSVIASVREHFAPFDCIIDSAADAHAACEAIGAFRRDPRYDGVISDIHVTCGYQSELLERMKSRGRLPVVLTCGFGDDPLPWYAKAHAIGVRLMILKPFRADQLYSAVAKAIDGSP